MLKILFVLMFSICIYGCATTKTEPVLLKSETGIEQEQQVVAEVEQPKTNFSPSNQAQVRCVKLSREQIQIALKNANLYDGPIDGKIGKKTKAAIKEFQKAHNLKVDGIVGKQTSLQLEQYLK